MVREEDEKTDGGGPDEGFTISLTNIPAGGLLCITKDYFCPVWLFVRL